MKKGSKGSGKSTNFAAWSWWLLGVGAVGMLVMRMFGIILGADLFNVLLYPFLVIILILLASSYFGFRSKSLLLKIISVFSALFGLLFLYATIFR